MQQWEAKEYRQVKEAIFRCYDINEETYRRRFREMTWKSHETPLEMLTRITDLAVPRTQVMDAIIEEQFNEVFPESAKIWVRPTSSTYRGRKTSLFFTSVFWKSKRCQFERNFILVVRSIRISSVFDQHFHTIERTQTFQFYGQMQCPHMS